MEEQQSRSVLARLSLEGLSIGDAFGQMFFYPGVLETADPDHLPDAPWEYTDDTEMAMAIVSTLESEGEIDQDKLAKEFASRFVASPRRGYGRGAMELLQQIHLGESWKTASKNLFHGTGSYGNGGAMRVAPLGAWFKDDIPALINQAKLSAVITHSHHEGQAGAIAVALAAAWAASKHKTTATQMLPWIVGHLEESEVRRRVEQVCEIPLDAWEFDVANQVGSGHQISAQDTVAFCLWVAAAHYNDYSKALWVAARVGGDVDTTCAIIGGIVSLNVGLAGIPLEWRRRREELLW